MNITIRAQAKFQQKDYYFTGKSCKRGHISNRFTSNGTCVKCHRMCSKQSYAKNPEQTKSQAKKWYTDNKDRAVIRSKDYYQGNKEQIKNNSKTYYHKNKTDPLFQEKSFIARKQWRKNNGGLMVHYNRLRRKHINERTPCWVDLEQIKFFYECCPKGCHVDHKIPLQGKNISGLHVVENLQWLPSNQNLSKSNKYEPHEAN